jgi:hypothetical protein
MDLCEKPHDIQSISKVKPELNYGKIPLYFIYNKGQVNEKAKFYSKASRYTLWLTKEGLIFDSIRGQGSGVRMKKRLFQTHLSLKPPSHQDTKRAGKIKKTFIIHRTNSSLIIHLLTHSPSTNETYQDLPS